MSSISSMSRTKKILLALVALVVVGVAALFIVVKVFFDDAPPKLGTKDLEQAVGTQPLSTGLSTGPSSGVDGTWSITQDATTVGYRVKEVLGGIDAEAAGRTNQVTGSITVTGTKVTAGSFSVDMASISSDSGRRDGQFRGPIMDVATYPTASFVLTAPIEFGTIPADGANVTATATGDLTLHGVKNSVTFPVQAKLANGRIGVLGNIKVVFADYGIPNPSNGFAETGDDGLLEFVLVFTKA